MHADEATTPKTVPSIGRRSIYVLFVGIGVAIGTLVLGGVALYESRNDTWDRARQNAGNLLLALDRDIGRNIATVDLSLQGVLEALHEPGIEEVSPGIRRHALFDRSADAEGLGSLLVMDRDGNVIADSTSLVPHTLNLGDRDYFQAQKSDPKRGLFIGRAMHSRLAGGDPRFALARSIVEPDGSFGGIVSATIRLDFFKQLFEKLDLGQEGVITLIRTDGRLIYRRPMREGDFDLDVSARVNSSFRHITSVPAGQYVAGNTLDGVERLISFRQIGDLPLVLAVSVSTKEIFEPWWNKAIVIGVSLLLLCASAVASSILFWCEMLRRTRTEEALAAAAVQLAIQASTDPLTGLHNRRAMDEEFDRAFRVAIRGGATIAVLMIDVDFFKRFNDTYGHVAGDDVLRAIAGCMQLHIRRPGDCVARFGGEEFVAILPETSEASAMLVAERIREGIDALRIPHTNSPFATVSVSIGVASATPLVGDRQADLLNLADQSLYAAKESGRNRVRSAHGACIGSNSVALADLVLAATTRQSSGASS